jgi:hypothetical protein
MMEKMIKSDPMRRSVYQDLSEELSNQVRLVVIVDSRSILVTVTLSQNIQLKNFRTS